MASPYHDDGPLQGAARALLRAVPDEKAVEVAASIDDPQTRALALTALADILGGYGWDDRVGPGTKAAEGALSAASSIAAPAARIPVLAIVMEIVARADRIPEALAAARSIPESYASARSHALFEIAKIQAERVRYDEAWQIAQACAAPEKLAVYATILDTHATKPDWKRRFSHKTRRDR